MSPSSPDALPARLLVVDDDEGLLILMSETLRSEGYEVDTATSCQGALVALQGAAPDLVLLDLKLRDAEGLDLLRKYAACGVGAPFVVVTGQGDEKTAVEVMKHGALDYVLKDGALLDLLPTVVKRTLSGLAHDRAMTAARAEHQRLEAEVFRAAERERQTIGADLHDGLGQLLTAVEFMCTALKDEAMEVRPEFAARLGQMSGMLREAVAQTRYLARGLVPVQSGPDALFVGLAELAARTDALGRVHCQFEAEGQVEIADAAIANHLYRIAQEAVNNAVKHARASVVALRLERREGFLRLEISDDGEGLKPELDERQGVGLGVMRHRAQAIGAALTMDSQPGRGLVVTCTLPLAP